MITFSGDSICRHFLLCFNISISLTNNKRIVFLTYKAVETKSLHRKALKSKALTIYLPLKI